jgi:hypothetical protein
MVSKTATGTPGGRKRVSWHDVIPEQHGPPIHAPRAWHGPLVLAACGRARAEGDGLVLRPTPVEEAQEISEEERLAEEAAKVRKRWDRISPTMMAIVSR